MTTSSAARTQVGSTAKWAVGVVVVFAFVLVVALNARRHSSVARVDLGPAKFDFLGHHLPIANSSTLAYAFRSDGNNLVEKAKAELRLRGYSIKVHTSDGSAIKAENETEVIDVIIDARWRCSSDSHGSTCSSQYEPGWVSIVFWERNNPFSED